MVMKFDNINDLKRMPSPMVFGGGPRGTPDHNTLHEPVNLPVGAELTHNISSHNFDPCLQSAAFAEQMEKYQHRMPKFGRLHSHTPAGDAAANNETATFSMAFQGEIV